MITQLKKDLRKLEDKEQAKHLARFFKTGKGQYGEGDKFLGIKVPVQRQIARKYKELPLNDLQKLLDSKIHEHRLVALLILVEQYQKNPDAKIVNFYLGNAKRVNNWDLVDLSAPKIVGAWLVSKNAKERKVLYTLAKSENLWEKRIAILSTFTFIQNNQFQDTLKISEILLSDSHDLIHKATGWMLREVGKRDQPLLEKFLKKHYSRLARTALRYAIEKFDEAKRKRFLRGEV